MARMTEDKGELDDTTNCPVCLESFDTKDHVPRLLPCTHTTCENCMLALIRIDGLVCPQCRKKHQTQSGFKAFPQNKYVIKILNIRKEMKRSSEGTDVFEMCPDHNKELSIYCKSDGCKKDICQVCMINNHRGHKVFDYVDQEKKMHKLREIFSHCEHSLSSAREEVDESCTETITVLKKMKTEQTKFFNNLIKLVTNCKKGEKKYIDKQLDVVKAQKIEYSTFTDKTSPEAANNAFRNRVQAMMRIEKDLRHSFRDKTSYKCYHATAVQSKNLHLEKMKRTCGQIVEKDIAINLPWKPVVAEFYITTEAVDRFLVLSDDSILIGGKQRDVYHLARYNIHGRLLSSTEIKDKPTSIVEVQLPEKACLALSYYEKQKINFHAISRLEEVTLSHTTPHEPSRMCTSSASTLLYVHPLKLGREIHSLNCRALPPTPGRSVIHAQRISKGSGSMHHIYVYHMCCVSSEKKQQLLVTVTKSGKLEAFDMVADKLEWTAPNNLQGMDNVFCAKGLATDGRGHVFVCDSNNKCVQMFSADGKFIRTLLREGEHGIGTLWWVQWFDKTSSLVVYSRRNKQRVISVITVYL